MPYRKQICALNGEFNTASQAIVETFKLQAVRKSVVTFVLLMFLAGFFVQNARANTGQFAIVAGISGYPTSSNLWPLQYAHIDAQKVAEALEQRGYTVRLLLNADAKKRAIMGALKEARAFFDRSDSNSSIVFFFAGHGFTDQGVEWLIPEDGAATDPAGSGVSLDIVQDMLANSGAGQRMLFIDACRENTSSERGFSRVFDETRSTEAEGTAISFSTKLGSTSVEVSDLRQGVYSYFLARGLQGATGVEPLTFSDLHRYVADNVRDYTVRSGLKLQVPFRAGEHSGEFFIGSGFDRTDTAFLESEVEQLVQSMETKNIDRMTAIANLSPRTKSLMRGVFEHYSEIKISQPPSMSFNDSSAEVRVTIDYVTDVNGTRVIPSARWRSIDIQSERRIDGWSRLYE